MSTSDAGIVDSGTAAAHGPGPAVASESKIGSNRPAAARRPPMVVLVLGAVMTIVAGFGAGFALSATREPGGLPGGAEVGAPQPSTAKSAVTRPPEPTTTTGPAPTPSTTTETTVPGVDSTTVPTTTLAPPTSSPPTAAPITTAPRSTVPSTAAPPTTFAPPDVLVTYASDGAGRLVIPRGGTATLQIANRGGLASQYLVTGTGFTTTGAASQGTLNPGQSLTLMVGPPPGELPPATLTGIISVLGATNPSVPFVIP